MKVLMGALHTTITRGFLDALVRHSADDHEVRATDLGKGQSIFERPDMEVAYVEHHEIDLADVTHQLRLSKDDICGAESGSAIEELYEWMCQRVEQAESVGYAFVPEDLRLRVTPAQHAMLAMRLERQFRAAA